MLARPTRETQPCELNSTRLVGSDGAELGLVSDGAELGFVSDGAELGLVSDGAELGLVSDGAELGSWLTSQCSVVQCAVQCSAPCSAVRHAVQCIMQRSHFIACGPGASCITPKLSPAGGNLRTSSSSSAERCSRCAKTTWPLV